MTPMVRVEQVLDSWKTIRADTAQAVEDMPAGDLGFKPVEDVAGFGEIARHILDASHAVTGMLLAGVEDLSVNYRAEIPRYTHPLAADAPPAALAKALREAVGTRSAELAAQTPEWWAKVVTRFDGTRVTRLELVQIVKEHELTHRSQLFMYLRLKGIIPVTTRRRMARQ